MFCFLGKTVYLQCITLPGVQLMGTVKLNAWSGELKGRIKPAMDYAIPSGDVFVFNPGPSCY